MGKKMNWYKKSQLNDETLPQEEMLYHGTNEDFDNFELGRESVNIGMLGTESTVTRHAIFFAKNKDLASEYGRNIKEINQKLLNIFDFESKENNSIFSEFHTIIKNDEEINREINDGSFQDWGYFDGTVGEKFVPFLKSKGFNAARLLDTGIEEREDEVIAIFDMNVINRFSRQTQF
jgi:hypothetical protein